MLIGLYNMIFLVQSSLSHSMVLFFSSLSLFVGWLSEGKKYTKLLSSIEDTRPGWTRRTEKWLKEVSMSHLPYAFSCMARWSIYCCHSSCLFVERVCAVTIWAWQWHWRRVCSSSSNLSQKHHCHDWKISPCLSRHHTSVCTTAQVH